MSYCTNTECIYFIRCNETTDEGICINYMEHECDMDEFVNYPIFKNNNV